MKNNSAYFNDGVENVLAENMGTTLTENRFGDANKASYFDGSSHIRTNLNFDSTDDITYSLWFRWEDGTGLIALFGQTPNLQRTLRISASSTTARFSAYCDTISNTGYAPIYSISINEWYKAHSSKQIV